MVITELTLDATRAIPGDPLRIRVGQPVVEDGYVVEKINYQPKTNLYHKGEEYAHPCYVVFFVGIPERRLIAESMVTTMEVTMPAKNKTTATEGANVSLPE
jgi:hypothetical protein